MQLTMDELLEGCKTQQWLDSLNGVIKVGYKKISLDDTEPNPIRPDRAYILEVQKPGVYELRYTRSECVLNSTAIVFFPREGYYELPAARGCICNIDIYDMQDRFAEVPVIDLK